MSNLPPMKVSDEAKEHQLDMAREQGDAYTKALNEMANNVADHGGEQPVDDYVVAYAIEDAEGMYQMKAGELEWQDPGDKNKHIEISVRDRADNRFIAGLEIEMTLIDSEGNQVFTHDLPMLWHPWLYHYGRNVKIDKSGEYSLKVHVKAPGFGRHDKKNGKRYANDVDVEFDGIKIEVK